MTLSKEKIAEIIHQKITRDERPGEQVGGSGHLGYKSFELKSIETTELANDSIQVVYDYLVTIETEFTYYPDNPPTEYLHRKKIILNSKGEIVKH